MSRRALKKVLRSPLSWALLLCFGIQFAFYAVADSYQVCGDTSSYTYEYDRNFRTPVYPIFTHAIRIFTGDGEREWLSAIATAQKVLFFASILLFFAIVAALTKNKFARFLATAFYGGSPAIFGWANCILTETFSIIEMVALVYCIVIYLKKKSKVAAIMSGVVALIMVLTRPAAVYLLLVLAIFWGVQLFAAIRRKTQKRRTAVRYGFIGLLITIVGTLGYCGVHAHYFGTFSLSSVSKINDLLVVVSDDLYIKSDNEEMKSYIWAEKQENSDPYIIIHQRLFKTYPREEVEDFAKDVISKNKWLYIKNMIRKTISWGATPMGTTYVVSLEDVNVNLDNVATMLFPVTFGFVYMFIAGGCLWLVVRMISKKRIDWVMLLAMMLVGGNVAVTILAAPFEPARLCVTSLPVIVVCVVYLFEVFSRSGGGKRIESPLKSKR